MQKRIDQYVDHIVTVALLWFGALPFLWIMFYPLFGLRITGVAALGLFALMVPACWIIFGWQVFGDRVAQAESKVSHRRTSEPSPVWQQGLDKRCEREALASGHRHGQLG